MDGSVRVVKRATINPKSIPGLLKEDIECFLTPDTAVFFERFDCVEFLQQDPFTWQESDSCKEGLEIVSELTVVNATAERGVKLMEDYNKLITKNEVVKDYRSRFPDHKKKDFFVVILIILEINDYILLGIY